MKRLSKYFKGVLPFFAAEGIQFLVLCVLYIIASIFVVFQYGIDKGVEGLTDSSNLTKVIEAALTPEITYSMSVISILVCGVIFYFWYRREIRGEVRGRIGNVFNVKNLILFAFLGIGCQFFITGIMSLLQSVFVELFEEYAKTVENLTTGSDAMVLLLVVLAAPIVEELIFRGVILHKTSKVISFMGANILQALLFGIYHWNIVQGVYATLIGLLLGLVYRKFKTIFAPILLHMIINFSAFFVLLMPDIAISYLTVLGAILLGITLFLLKPFFFMQQVPIQNSEIEQ